MSVTRGQWQIAIVSLKSSLISGSRFLPETRTMPTPPRPGGVAIATIGEESVFIVDYLSKQVVITDGYFSNALSLL